MNRYRLLLSIVAAAAIAVVVAILFGSTLRARPDRGKRLRALVRASAATGSRVTEGRLSGGFDYQPPLRFDRKGDAPSWARLDAVAAETIANLVNDGSGEALHTIGIAHLLTGREAAAIADLERATGDDHGSAPADALLLSDLAAAYLARSDANQSDVDLRKALNAAERSWQLRQTPEAAWNRALALAKINAAETEVAWRGYLAVDAASPWAAEARRRIETSTDERG